MKINGLTTQDIIIELLNDDYYSTVDWGFMVEAVNTAKQESHAKTVEELSKYIKENLI